MQNYSDEKLIVEYFKGNKKAFDFLVQRYLKPVYSFSYRYVGNYQQAEDIAQEVFLKAWRNLKKFDRKKSFKTWVFSIAKNTSIDWLRKKKSIPFSRFENEEKKNIILEKLTDSSPLPDELFERNNLSRILTSAMTNLSTNYRMVLFLRYNDHFTFREIAETLEEPLNTVKSRHRRALVLLKNFLKI